MQNANVFVEIWFAQQKLQSQALEQRAIFCQMKLSAACCKEHHSLRALEEWIFNHAGEVP